jgi:hypothetical protein
MAHIPARREIPAGKILLADYGDQNYEAAIIETIAEAFAPHPAINATVRLQRSSPGFEPAGSRARWTNGYFAVRWRDRGGATQGRRYPDDPAGEAEARARFAALTALP